MRIAELSERSGVPIPTIKYYLREGLLPRGEATGRNQARYGDEHLSRLRLVRALTTVGGLSVATVREVLAEVGEPDVGLHSKLGLVMRRLPLVGDDIEPLEEDRERALALVTRRGWHFYPDHPALHALAVVLAGHREVGHSVGDADLDRYAEAAEGIAAVDLDRISGLPATEEVLEGAVVKTVLGDTLLTVLRRLAQVDESAARNLEGAGRRAARGD
ncbi:MerR family transcriptional regulator [Nocardiopsis changdeensis]|uniref:MerR family transcriptional regulator n=1 Tax=Nocardiopsis changdeensis TaxID=2831969 RepID=A0ABX8BN00_9ACTN|nr:MULTISPECIES: MerR family transcriptional regulator [Nocardiopsis]QUX22953.1 MerR family transcriptional regulator [Nocardiopsis changdeensis]QYX38896.1 MerR family transcriptional regulator [Nocardiopsis sp. MT53]